MILNTYAGDYLHIRANGNHKAPLPVKATLGIFNPISNSGVTTPSTVPNIDPSPRESNMRKKRTDQTGLPGMFMIASVKTTNANPVPCEA